ncbi:MAG TPA: nuclear transport factor 2 family protein [Gemmatimonadales bacterium]|jgi:uncharacterized protein (TIGR02246 family)
MHNRLRFAAGLFALSTVAAGCARPSREDGKAGANAAGAKPADTRAAEAEIRRGDEEFFAAAKARDANAIAALYSDDAISMPPNSPPLVGHDAILKYNQDFVKAPGLTISGGPETIRFSDDGTMAYETGRYSVSYADPKGRTVKDEGKYLNVLRREGGKWKVVADAFSSNLAPPK